MKHKDPICGMSVEDTSPHHLEVGGEQVFFCSEHCKEKFKSENHQAGSEAELKDPVCGMTVSPGSPHSATHENHLYQFCSAGCRDKFAASPDKFIHKAADDHGGGSKHDNHAVHAHHGSSQQVSADKPSSFAAYSCPMHPEIKQQEPGNCSKCGMALKLRTELP